MLIEQPPKFFRALYPQAIFRMDPGEKAVYLTFDDGPIPEVTPWVLSLLERYSVKATFFMVGDNIRKHPEEYAMVVRAGHRIGNHTYNHIRGFEYSAGDYLANVEKANELMHTDIFRPPHGHVGFRQYHTLRKHYRIIMWDLVTRDYSKRMTREQVLDNVKRYVRPGSIITFHDSLKSWSNGNLQYALPRAIDYLKQEGYEFKLL
jgi:peptidoglycan/xylan/chitin deacetylase (PgdA/CDA1 family)